MKKLASLFLALALSLSLCVPALAAEFSDVPASHPFHDAIIRAADRGIVSGYNDGTFKPANTVTRAQFCAMLSRAFYADDVTRYTTDSNLKYGTFTPNFLALKNNGILNNSNFSQTEDIINAATMNQGISRYDMAQLMTNIMNKNGFSASSADKNAAIAKISDYNEIPSQYRDAVANVYALGIIGGYSNGTFGGTITMNRGQGAVVIYRLAQYVGYGPAPAPVDIKTETPGQTTKTLVDGSAITEENVMRLMEAKIAEWGNKRWGERHPSGNPTIPYGVPPYPGGSGSDVQVTVDNYTATYTDGLKVSCTGGCGGWATYLSDAAFGRNGFPLRKTTPDNIRAGDILLELIDGKIDHIAIVSGYTTISDYVDYTKTYYGRYETNAGSVPGNSPHGIDPTSPAMSTNYDTPSGFSWVIYTRYPE